VAIGAVVALLGLSAWLYKPMSKAWNNKRAVDHPSENTFDLGKGGCVQPQCPALGVCRQAPRTTHPQPHTPRIPNAPSHAPFSGSGTRGTFPSLADKPTLYLSVIVPAYNEEKRIPEEKGIDDMIAKLTARQAQNA
jgi:hypothetical protein